MNSRCTPSGILPAHGADQVPNSARDRRPSALAVPYLPSPKQTEAFAMPGDNRFGLDKHQRRAPTAPDAGSRDPEETIRCRESRALFRRALQHGDLMAQSQDLELSVRE